MSESEYKEAEKNDKVLIAKKNADKILKIWQWWSTHVWLNG